MKVIGPYSLKSSQVTSPVLSKGASGPISIQSVTKSLCGSPSYTLEVSNDKETWHKFDQLSTNVEINNSLQINYPVFTWEYLRLNLTSNIGDSGEVSFHINIIVNG